MAAARRDGAAVVYVGALGTGPFGELARAALAAESITLAGPTLLDRDTGFSVVMVDDAAQRTFVSAPGAEVAAPAPWPPPLDVRPADLVYVTGYSLAHPVKGAALLDWLEGLDPRVAVLADASPLVEALPLAWLRRLARRAGIWSLNLTEGQALAARLAGTAPATGPATGPATAPEDQVEAARALAASLAARLGGAVVLRLGPLGAVVVGDWGDRLVGGTAPGGAAGAAAATPCEPGPTPGGGTAPKTDGTGAGTDLLPGDGPVWVPAYPVRAVDTTGAGDAHCGVLAAGLLRGDGLVAAVRRAGVAAGLAVTKLGPATAPSAEATTAALAHYCGKA
jgi:sugar/nucleoside kinase (ribokinase family)